MAPFRSCATRRVGRLAALSLLTVLAPAATLLLPGSDAVAVIGPSGRGSGPTIALVARAGGTVLREGGRDNIVVAVSSERGFVARLYREGAWLVLDPLIAGGCASFNVSARS